MDTLARVGGEGGGEGLLPRSRLSEYPESQCHCGEVSMQSSISSRSRKACYLCSLRSDWHHVASSCQSVSHRRETRGKFIPVSHYSETRGKFIQSKYASQSLSWNTWQVHTVKIRQSVTIVKHVASSYSQNTPVSHYRETRGKFIQSKYASQSLSWNTWKIHTVKIRQSVTIVKEATRERGLESPPRRQTRKGRKT